MSDEAKISKLEAEVAGLKKRLDEFQKATLKSMDLLRKLIARSMRFQKDQNEVNRVLEKAVEVLQETLLPAHEKSSAGGIQDLSS